ncbi:MAG: hypothetical protein HQ481_01145 [Alphaproteobacteria bacterium]|nr:hypothetical protein [Alphaproteobacteria bacterium]
MATPTIFRQYIDVLNRLDELGTHIDFLIEAAHAGVAAANECTDNDPLGARGWRRWQMATRRLRETHIGYEDWRADNTNQIPSVVEISRNVRIIVYNTDEGTCTIGKEPKNKLKKGSGTDQIVEINQYNLFPEPEKFIRVVDFSLRGKYIAPLITYALCVFHEDDDVRAELSCVIETADGFFEGFSERIFLFGGDFGGGVPVKKKHSGNESEFDIPVVRKK